MIFPSKYQDTQTEEPVKIKTSPFRNLDRTRILIEKVFREENHMRKKLIFENPWLKNGEYLKIPINMSKSKKATIVWAFHMKIQKY